MNKQKIIKLLRKPSIVLLKLDNINLIKLSDKKYIELRYFSLFLKELNLDNPKSFNEKLQWLKLYDRNSEYTKMVDKYEVKKYVSNIIGEEYIIPTLGIYNSFEEINFDKLPNQFVLKCTHDSGGIVICKDKNNLDVKQAKNKINKSLKKNYYYSGREWPYKNVKPRIIVEKYMEESDKKELKDYKLFCFNGIPQIVLVCSERYSSENMCETWFDMNWNLIDVVESGHRIDTTISKPKKFKEMIALSKKLSKGIPFIRVDWYEIKGKLYFGELTFYPASGFEKFEPEEWNYKMGEMLELPKKKISDDNEK